MNIKQMPRVSEIKASVTVDELCNETRPPELAEFCAVVQSEMRGVKFADHSSRGVTVYRENDVFAMGNLYYADFRDTGDNEPMFIVESPYILNEKYAHGRAQQNMKMSKNLSTSVRTAKKFLRSHSPFFMARVVADDFSLSVSRVWAELSGEVDDLKEKLFGSRYGSLHEPMLNEFMHLLNSGHQFADVSFGANLQEYVTKQRQYTDLRDRYSEVYFVRAYERFGEANFDVLRINKSPRHMSAYISEGEVTHSHHKQDDLPEHIMGKLAVLQMMERNQYVEEVGTSMGDGMFYVVL